MESRHAVGLAALLTLAGCTHHVLVRSEPPGAKLWVDNTEIGATPVRFDEERGRTEPYRLRLEKPGYRPKETLVLPLQSKGRGCFLIQPWAAAMPDELVFQLFPAGAVTPD